MDKSGSNPSGDDIKSTIESYFEHVNTHDLTKVKGAISFVANESNEQKGAFHVCALHVGSPSFLAEMMVKAIDTMIEDVPGFEKMFKRACEMKQIENNIQELADQLKKAGVNINIKSVNSAEEAMALIKKMTAEKAPTMTPEQEEKGMEGVSDKVVNIMSALNKKNLH